MILPLPKRVASASALDSAGAKRSCVGADFLECSREGLDVCLGKVLGEVAFDSVAVMGAGAFEYRAAFSGENDEDRAAVLLGADATDEARFFHPVDDSGEAALAVEDPVGKQVHRDPVGGFLEVDEDVVPTLRDTRVPLELCVEDVEEREGALEEQPPSAQSLARRT